MKDRYKAERRLSSAGEYMALLEDQGGPLFVRIADNYRIGVPIEVAEKWLQELVRLANLGARLESMGEPIELSREAPKPTEVVYNFHAQGVNFELESSLGLDALLPSSHCLTFSKGLADQSSKVKTSTEIISDLVLMGYTVEQANKISRMSDNIIEEILNPIYPKDLQKEAEKEDRANIIKCTCSCHNLLNPTGCEIMCQTHESCCQGECEYCHCFFKSGLKKHERNCACEKISKG